MRNILILLVIFLSSCAHENIQKADNVCNIKGESIKLYTHGMYGGYPQSVLRDVVSSSVSCPNDNNEIKYYHIMLLSHPHLHITIIRPLGQGQKGYLSAKIFANGRFIIGERTYLSPFSRTQSPYSVKADIHRATMHLWHDLAIHMAHKVSTKM